MTSGVGSSGGEFGHADEVVVCARSSGSSSSADTCLRVSQVGWSSRSFSAPDLMNAASSATPGSPARSSSEAEGFPSSSPSRQRSAQR